MIAPAMGSAIAPASTKSPPKASRLGVGLGLGYLSFTLVCMAWYIQLLAPSLTNDLYWPTYNRTGFAVFLVDLVNVKLRTAIPQSANLLDAESMAPKIYAYDDIQATFESGYPRMVYFTELSSLSRAIHGIRGQVDADVYAHYCWVDLDRRWDIAHTRARAARCQAKYTDNAANYLETTFRNTNWTAFYTANFGEFSTIIALALQATEDGRQWLEDRPLHSMMYSVEDEVAFLQSRNLTRYQLTYQNEFKGSIAETVDLESALRQRQTMVLKAASFGWGTWSTVNMFWNFRNDLYLVASANKSLVRGDPNHFEQSRWQFFQYYSYQDENNLLWNQNRLFSDNVGPFGSVDVLYVPLPRTLLSLYGKLVTFLNDKLWSNVDLERQVLSLSHVHLQPQPPNFFIGHSVKYYGGNLLCLDSQPTSYPQGQFAYDDGCAQTLPFIITGTPQTVVMALLLMSNKVNPEAVCTLKATTNDMCTFTLHEALAVVRALDALPPEVLSLIERVAGDVPPVAFYQYAKNSTGDWVFMEQPLLTPDDPNWSFIGWLAIVEWIQGKREVVALEGDVSTVFMMSEVNPAIPVPLSSQAQGDQSGPQMMYNMVVYTTVLSTMLGGVILLYAIRNGLRFEGRNLFEFNRVACFVWIGRPLLLLRGLTAVLILSSTTASIGQVLGHAKLIQSPRPWWNTLLVTGESTWVCCVACDVVLVVTSAAPEYFAPLACSLAWLVTLVIEVQWPIVLTASLGRQCVALGLDRGMDCTSGVIQTGDSRRILLLLGIQIASVVVSIGLVRWWKGAKPRDANAPLLLHGSAESFLRADHDATKDTWQLDDVMCVMTGLLPWSFRGRHYTFDVKLWILLQDSSGGCERVGGGMAFPCPSFARPLPQSTSPTSSIIQSTKGGALASNLTVLAGTVYIALSGVGSVSYITVSTVNFANDFYWATFNMTGHHVVIVDWFNEQFMLQSRLPPVQLDDTRWTTLWRNYSNPKITTSTPPGVGLTVQLDRMTELEMAIAGLRRSDACGLPWVSTQYCWVDFNRKWPMANSRARQQRCLTDVSNGAVYLEAVLRNVDWTAFDQCWGASFDTAIANELSASADGKTWLSKVKQHPQPLKYEVNEWRAAGVIKYLAQWQAYKMHGFINTYLVENALGVQYPMTLTRGNGSLTFVSQTSFKMYWGLASDLWAVSSNKTLLGGKSLISTSANYAFANQTMLQVLVQNGTLVSPLYEAFRVFQREVGPFGSIDMKLVACPEAVRQLVAAGLDAIRRGLASIPADAALAYKNVTVENVQATPTSFRTWPYPRTMGGSLLCPESSDFDLATLLQLTKRDFACGPALATRFIPTADTLFISVMAARLSFASASQIEAVCWHDRNFERCQSLYLAQTTQFIRDFVLEDDVAEIEALALAALAPVRSHRVSLMQYLRQAKSAPLELGRGILMDAADPTYEVWSWLYVIEWAMGSCEVVTFQGDAGSITIITDISVFNAQVIQATEMPTTFATYARWGVQYVTSVMLAITCLFGMYIVSSRGHIEVSNVLKLNRVAGIVWIGRPLLFLRSLTALCLLSTSTLELESYGDAVANFKVQQVPWYKTILSAGETTWLVYILNDLLMVWTKESTASYATKSSLLVWLVSAILTLLRPVQHRVLLDPTCQIDQMDFQLVCNSGVVYIGDIHRLYWLLGIIGLSNLVCYVHTRLQQPRRARESPDKSSLLLSAAAKYLFSRAKWTYGGIYYMDSASAVLNGLLTFHQNRRTYVLDIKLWRCFVIPSPDNVPPHLQYAVPLAE